MLVYRILGGIYLSTVEPLNNNVDLKADYNITHILSMIPGKIPHNYASDYTLKQIEITDEETSNILDEFEGACDFIDSALFPSGLKSKKHEGSILVHCAQGISRSVAIIIVYLMKSYKLNYQQALHAIKRKKNDVEPNEGFIKQIEIFEKMKFKLDKSNDDYKQFIIDLNLKLDPSGQSLREVFKANKLHRPANTNTISKDIESELRCKRCRHILANSSEIAHHDPPEADSAQSQFIRTAPKSRRIVESFVASANCSHYFVNEPLTWMQLELEKEELEGKFACPKCEAKIGGYSWKGSRCSCGRWMIPAIHLQSARVDNIKKFVKLDNKVLHQDT